MGKGNGILPLKEWIAKRLGAVGQMFVEDLGDAFYPLMKELDTSEQTLLQEGCKGIVGDKDPAGVCLADFSDAALLEELRRRGYKGTITKVQEVEL